MEHLLKFSPKIIEVIQIIKRRALKNRKVLAIFSTVTFLVIIITASFFLNKPPTTISFVRVPSNITPQKDDIYTIRSLATQIAPVQYLNWSDKTKKVISPETKILIYFDTNTPVTQQQIDEIEKFINRGGSAIFMVDGIYIPQGNKPGPSSHNLFKLFEKYGIKLQTNLLVSQTNAVANIFTNQSSFSSQYPLWIKTANFSKTSSAFESITALTFPWSSSVQVVKSPLATTEILVMSEKNSWTQQNEFNLAPNEIPILTSDQQNIHNIVVQATAKSGGRILVIPSSRFVREQFLTMPAENVTFLGNILREYNAASSPSALTRVVQVLLIFISIGVILFALYLFIIWRLARAHR